MRQDDPVTARNLDDSVVNNHGVFIWRIANLLRGTYKLAQYGSVILPFVVLRRLDCLLEPTKDAVVEVIRRMNEVFDGGTLDDTDIGALSTHVVSRMLDNPVVRTQVATNAQQQLFDGETKRAEFFHSLISLLYHQGEQTTAG